MHAAGGVSGDISDGFFPRYTPTPYVSHQKPREAGRDENNTQNDSCFIFVPKTQESCVGAKNRQRHL